MRCDVFVWRGSSSVSSGRTVTCACTDARAQLDAIRRRQRGPDLDDGAERREGVARDDHLIGAVRQPFRDETALRIGLELLVDMIRRAHELDRASQRQPRGVDNHEAQFSRIDLRKLRHRECERDDDVTG